MGGGSLEFYVDRACYGPENDNAFVPMQLLMMTEHGCEAEAQFWMMDEPVDCGPDCNPDFGGGLYYSAKIQRRRESIATNRNDCRTDSVCDDRIW